MPSYGNWGSRPTPSYHRQNPDNPYGDVVDKHRGRAVIAGVLLFVFAVIPGVVTLDYIFTHH